MVIVRATNTPYCITCGSENVRLCGVDALESGDMSDNYYDLYLCKECGEHFEWEAGFSMHSPEGEPLAVDIQQPVTMDTEG